MRIAVLSDTMMPTPYRYGHGLGRAVYNVANGLCDKGHGVALYGLDGSSLPGGELFTIGGCGQGGELILTGMIGAIADAYDVAIDTGHLHALAIWRVLPTLAYFQDRASAPAPCAIFVSRDQRRHMGLDGPIVRNGVRIKDFPLYEGEREDYLLYLGHADWKHKGLEDARRVAQLAGRPLREHGHGCIDGPIDSKAKVPIIQRATAVLCPYYIDAGPQVPLEAMACGTPVVGYALAGMPEYVPDGGGMLGDTPEQLAALIDDVAQLEPADIRGVMIDAGFTVARQGDEIETQLMRLIDGERW